MAVRTYATPHGLVNALRSGSLSPVAPPTYLSIAASVQILFGRPALLQALGSLRSALPVVAYLLAMLATVWAAFHANGGRKGRDFLARYLCLGVLLWLWVSIVWYIAWYAVVFSLHNIGGEAAAAAFSHAPASQYLFGLTLYAFFLVLLVRSIRSVSAASSAANDATS